MSTSDPLLYDKEATAKDLEPWFSKHMMAMTAEGLHSKAEIAIELARRDIQIEALQKSLVYPQAISVALSNCLISSKG